MLPAEPEAARDDRGKGNLVHPAMVGSPRRPVPIWSPVGHCGIVGERRSAVFRSGGQTWTATVSSRSFRRMKGPVSAPRRATALPITSARWNPETNAAWLAWTTGGA